MKGWQMWLTTEELGDILDVTAADIDRVMSDDSFGKFAVLSATENSFIQAGNDWTPGPECQAFLREHGSDPWVLEHRDAKTGQLLRATGRVTLEQVHQAFLSYLANGQEWRQSHPWQVVRV